jgi:hypothetical protein
LFALKLVWLNNFEVPNSRPLEAQRLTNRVLSGHTVARDSIELPTFEKQQKIFNELPD